jgi:hypothetical protein
MKLQASDASAPEGLQSQNLSRPETRLSVNGLAIVHGRLTGQRLVMILDPDQEFGAVAGRIGNWHPAELNRKHEGFELMS